jgi:hypothetical protein
VADAAAFTAFGVGVDHLHRGATRDGDHVAEDKTITCADPNRKPLLKDLADVPDDGDGGDVAGVAVEDGP